MNRILCICLLALCVSFNSLAQVSSGSSFLRGTFSISSESFESGASNVTQIVIAPYYGYFIADGLAIGAGIGYNSYDGQGFSSSGIFVSPFVRKYKSIVEEKFLLFAQASVDYNSIKNNGNKTNIIALNLNPGFAYFMNEKWAIEFSTNVLGIRSSNPEGDNNNSTRFNLGLSLSPSLSLAFYF